MPVRGPRLSLAPYPYLHENAWLRKDREAVDLNRAQLAAGSHVTLSSIKAYEQGRRRMNADARHALLAYLDWMRVEREADARRIDALYPPAAA